MQRFHINPKTGNPGTCRAEKVCPFGDLTKDHYPSKEEARAAYEALQVAREDMRDVLTRTMEIEHLKGVWIDLVGGRQINGHVVEVTDDAFVLASSSQGVRTERDPKGTSHAVIPLSAVRRVGMNNSARTASAPGAAHVGVVPASMLTPGMTWAGSMVVKVEKIPKMGPTYSPSTSHVMTLSTGETRRYAIHHQYAVSDADLARRDETVPVEYLERAQVPADVRTTPSGAALTWASLPRAYASAVATAAVEDYNRGQFVPEWVS